jgi:transcriptional regulator with XRE-family HTH domain
MAKQETFADRLHSLREGAGVSQYRLGQLSQVSKQTLSRLELGLASPSWETVQALARGLGVSVEAFVIEPGNPPEVPPVKSPGRPRKSPDAAPEPKNPRGRPRKRA